MTLQKVTSEIPTAQPLDFHPLASLFPLLDGPAFDELVDDVRTYGLRQDIILHDDGDRMGADGLLQNSCVRVRFPTAPDWAGA